MHVAPDWPLWLLIENVETAFPAFYREPVLQAYAQPENLT
jgi:hypothetical protein